MDDKIVIEASESILDWSGEMRVVFARSQTSEMSLDA